MSESFRSLSRSIKIFNLGLIFVYLTAALWALPHSTLVVAGGLAAVFAATGLVKPIPNPSGGQIFPNNSVKIVSALIWSPHDVFLGVGVGSFLGLVLFRKYDATRAMGNGAGWGLAAAAATFAAHATNSMMPPGIARLATAAILAVVTNRITNEGIFSIYRSARYGYPYLATWRQNVLDQWPSQLLAAPMAIVLAAVAARLGSVWPSLGLTALSAVALPIPRQELAYYHRSQQALGEIVEAVVRALEGVDEGVRAHGDRVSTLAVEVGRRLGMSEESLRAVRLASRLHDVGLLAGPDATASDDRGASVGSRILARFPDQIVARIVRAHHERWDGTGVPDHKRGRAIPLGARILAAAEIYDSDAFGNGGSSGSRQDAVRRLRTLAGTALDPRVVKVLLGAVEGQGGDPAAVR